MVWLDTKSTWLGFQKDYVLTQNAFCGRQKQSWRCQEVLSQMPNFDGANTVGIVPRSP